MGVAAGMRRLYRIGNEENTGMTRIGSYLDAPVDRRWWRWYGVRRRDGRCGSNLP